MLVVASGDPVALRGNSRLTLSVGEQYGVVDEGGKSCRIRVSAYFYAIGRQRGAELITYHWHPQGRGRATGPHLHVNADVQVGTRWLGRVHLPTGPIALQDVIVLAIEELDVMPLRDEWDQLLLGMRHQSE